MRDSLPGTRHQFGWLRRASVVAMARGNRRPHLFGGSVLEDVRIDRIAGHRRPRGRRP